jgi:IS5 family transposase
MLRIHCVQLFYNLSDPAMEDLLYEVESVRRFTGVSLDKVPDENDPEMHQSKKGKQWYFGMKMHIGVDDVLGLVHSFEATPGNVHDLDPTARLLHGGEKRVWTDAGYRCQRTKRTDPPPDIIPDPPPLAGLVIYPAFLPPSRPLCRACRSR